MLGIGIKRDLDKKVLFFMNVPKISLIVPTYNRANFLKESIKSFLDQGIDISFYEIIVVDNNSNDETKNIIYDINSTNNFRIRYFFEKNQGLHYARNRGILEAKGEIIVFGDDDIVASNYWLFNILNEFEKNTNTGIVGGKILPIWEQSPPEWVYDYGNKQTHGVFAFLDYGNKRLILKEKYVFGCNFAIKKKLAIDIGGSFPDTFPKKLKHLSGTGECKMIDEVRKFGYEVVYLPEALVYHQVEAKRVTLNYFIDRYERLAIEEAYICFREKNKYKAFIFLLKRFFKKILNTYLLKLKKFNNESFCLAKRNLNYFIIIEKQYSYRLFFQIFKIMFNKSLYEYVKKRNYLDF